MSSQVVNLNGSDLTEIFDLGPNHGAVSIELPIEGNLLGQYFDNYPTDVTIRNMQGRVSLLRELKVCLERAETHRGEDRMRSLVLGTVMVGLCVIAGLGVCSVFPAMPALIVIVALVVLLCLNFLAGSSVDKETSWGTYLANFFIGVPKFMRSHWNKEENLKTEIDALKRDLRDNIEKICECLPTVSDRKQKLESQVTQASDANAERNRLMFEGLKRIEAIITATKRTLDPLIESTYSG